jgi:hypothetical protein
MGNIAHMDDNIRFQDLFQVARKAATSSCGRSEMKPTVSDRIAGRPSGSFRVRRVGSSVANSMSSATTWAWVRRLNSVDLPAFGLPTNRIRASLLARAQQATTGDGLNRGEGRRGLRAIGFPLYATIGIGGEVAAEEWPAARKGYGMERLGYGYRR